jgi:hypothetical protein
MTESDETAAKPAGAPIGLNCPECGTLAAMLLDEDQAFCDVDGCRILKWDPTQTRAEMAAEGVHEIDLRAWRGE